MKPILTLISLAFALSAFAQRQPLTLDDCIRIALENNQNVKQQQLSRQSREIAYNQARADLLPSLNANVSQNFTFGRSIGLDNTYQNTNSSQTSMGVSADITLFDGLRMKHNIDARRADMLASEADEEQMRDEIVMSVSAAFLQVLLNKELLQIADEQIELTRANITQRSELVESGRMAQGELYELQAQQAREELNRVQTANNLKLALLDLAQIMEMDDFETLDVASPHVDALINENILLSSATVYESALAVRPEIRSVQYRMESAQKELLMTKAQYYPSLSFGANFGTGYYNMSGRSNDAFASQLRNNMSNSLGFSLRIPIFNRFQVRNSVRNAQIAVQNSRIEIDKAKLELRKRIEQAYLNALAAKSRRAAADKSETASREAFRFAEQKYENGRANAYELSLAKNNLAQVLGEQAQAKYEYAFRLMMLELLKK